MSEILKELKCGHPKLMVNENKFRYCLIQEFYCPDCGKSWKEQIGTKDNPTYHSGRFNIAHHL